MLHSYEPDMNSVNQKDKMSDFCGTCCISEHNRALYVILTVIKTVTTHLGKYYHQLLNHIDGRMYKLY